jgi:hypothetical protein
MALYGNPPCNLIGLAFNSGPLDSLIVIAARRFSSAAVVPSKGTKACADALSTASR